MPRPPRIDIANEYYHVINRANARLPIFFEESDYLLLEQILREATDRYKINMMAYCLMPNHFHLVLQPRESGELQRFMQWVTLTHTQRWHSKYKTTGSGHLYQGRYKSFLIQGDTHLLTVVRYVERNPLRARLVKKSEDWKFSSVSSRISKSGFIVPLPITLPEDYLIFLNNPLFEKEKDQIRISVNRGNPYGNTAWTNMMIKRHGLEMTRRNRGRKIKGT